MDTESLTPQALAELYRHLQDKHPSNEPAGFTLDRIQHVFYRHGDFLAHYRKIDVDFVYDRQAGVYLVGFSKPHVPVLADLFWYYGGDPSLDRYAAADQYILGGLGMFKSRAGSRIMRSKEFIVPTELRSIERDMEVLS